MGAVGDELAKNFEAANSQFVETLRGLSDEQWKRTTNAEAWSIGVTAHHIAGSRDAVLQLVQLLATGPEQVPFTADMLTQANADHAREFADVGKEETIALAEQSATTTSAALRAISDEGYAKGAQLMGMDMTARRMVEGALIGHIQGHLQSIRETAGT